MKKTCMLLCAILISMSALPALAYDSEIVRIIDKDAAVYEVETVTCNGDTKGLGYGYDGCNDTSTNEIWIKESLEEPYKTRVFYHELGHLMFNNDPLAEIIFSYNFVEEDEYYHTWWENAAEYTERFFTGEIKPNIQFAYVGVRFAILMLDYLE